MGSYDWSLMVTITIASIVTAAINPRSYWFMPVLTLLLSSVVVFAQDVEIVQIYSIAFFSLLFLSGSITLMFKSSSPALWSSVSALTFFLYYAISYVLLMYKGTPVFWGAIAAAITLISLIGLVKIRHIFQHHPHKDHLTSNFLSTAVGFSIIALFVWLNNSNFLIPVVAAELILISWLSTKVKIPSLKDLSVIMTSILSAFLAIRLFGDLYYYLEEAPIYYLPVFYRAESIPLASMSISILLSSYFLRNKVNLRTLKVYDITGLLGLFVSAYFIGMNIVDNGLGLLKRLLL